MEYLDMVFLYTWPSRFRNHHGIFDIQPHLDALVSLMCWSVAHGLVGFKLSALFLLFGEEKPVLVALQCLFHFGLSSHHAWQVLERGQVIAITQWNQLIMVRIPTLWIYILRKCSLLSDSEWELTIFKLFHYINIFIYLVWKH